MRLTILGGGGFRTPLVVRAVAAAGVRSPIEEIVLHDVDPDRLAVIRAVATEQVAQLVRAPSIVVEPDRRRALDGAAFVFSAIRVGGTAGRIVDERVARELGLLGQETVGAGGLAYAMRTVPVADAIAADVADLAPQAWVINFTNPAGLVTEAMQARLGTRVIGICDTPIGLLRSAARVLELPPGEVKGDYLGLNHLGWLRSLVYEGHDYMAALLNDRNALLQLDEAALFDVDWLRVIGCLPGEYLHYYDPHIDHSQDSRAEFLHERQGAFYDAGPTGAAARWQAVLAEREQTYMAGARTREHAGPAERGGGGYHEVAVDLMIALGGGDPASMILNVANDGVIGSLPGDAVIEVSAQVDASGAYVVGAPAPLSPPQLGLVTAVKACERLAINAARMGSRDLAWQAFAEHPLVRSPDLGRRLLDRYLQADPALRRILTW